MDNKNITEMSFDEVFPPLTFPDIKSPDAIDDNPYGSNPLTSDNLIHESYDTECEHKENRQYDNEPSDEALKSTVTQVSATSFNDNCIRTTAPSFNDGGIRSTAPSFNESAVQPPFSFSDSEPRYPNYDAGVRGTDNFPRNETPQYFDTNRIKEEYPQKAQAKKPSSIVIIMGFLSIFIGFNGLGIIFAIIGLIMANKNNTQNGGQTDKASKQSASPGKILCIIGICLNLLRLSLVIIPFLYKYAV